MIKSAVFLFAAAVLGGPVAEAQTAPRSVLFPSPFVVEHRLSQSSGTDSEWRTDPVTDYYGGSWIVSVRADGNRTVIDLSRREITEVQTVKGAYWTLTFGRMAELRRRLARADADPGATKADSARERRERAKPHIKIEDVAGDRGGSGSGSGGASARARDGEASLDASPGVRHVRASSEGGHGAVEAWLDPKVRLSKDARAAIASFEGEALGATSPEPEGEAPRSELLAAARDSADGAFPVRTRSRVSAKRADSDVVEDVVSRLEPIAALPQKLLTIPETFRRVPSPLEAMVSFAEEEAARSSTGLARQEAQR